MDSKQYHDMDGKPCTLYQLVRKEPAWAQSRIESMTIDLAEFQDMQMQCQKQFAEIISCNEHIARLEDQLNDALMLADFNHSEWLKAITGNGLLGEAYEDLKREKNKWQAKYQRLKGRYLEISK